MNKGWICLYRKLVDWEWFDNANMVQLWIYLLLTANTKTNRWHGVTVEVGQLITTRMQLSTRLHMSEQTVRTCLKRLQDTGNICMKSTSQYTLITICNFVSYQGEKFVTNQQLTNNQPTTNQQLTNNQPHYNNITIYNNTINNNMDMDMSEKNKFFSDPHINACAHTYVREDEVSDFETEPVETLELEKEKNCAKKEKENSDVQTNVEERKKVPRKKESLELALPLEVETTQTLKIGSETLNLDKFVEFFNNSVEKLGLPKIRLLTAKRKQALKDRIKEHGKTAIIEVLQKVSQSDFLLGRNDRGWRADFDFIFRRDKFLQILEGKYSEGDGLFERETNNAAVKTNDTISEMIHPEMNELKRQKTQEIYNYKYGGLVGFDV